MLKVSILLDAYMLASIITAGLFYMDKTLAVKNKSRLSEKNLIMASISCGWPGALIAMKLFRHKTQKSSFKFMIMLSVIANLVGVSYLLNTINY